MKGVFSEFAEEGLNMQWTDECFDEIKCNDKVWYETAQGQVHTAKAVMSCLLYTSDAADD
mgnify:CR=1 FL=1